MADRREVFDERDIGPIDAGRLTRIEALVQKETGAPPSATQVGRVFGCSSPRGLNVLVRDHGGGAKLVVNDVGAPNARASVLALQASAFLILLPLIMISALGLGGARWFGVFLGVVLLAALMAGPVRKWQRRHRVRRVADVIERTLVRVEPETRPAGEEVEAAAKDERPERRRA